MGHNRAGENESPGVRIKRPESTIVPVRAPQEVPLRIVGDARLTGGEGKARVTPADLVELVGSDTIVHSDEVALNRDAQTSGAKGPGRDGSTD